MQEVNKVEVINRKGKGRPTAYTPELGKEICRRLARGETLINICRDKHVPARSNIYNWLWDDRYQEFQDMYARAREMQAHHLFDETLDIADDARNDWTTKKFGKEEVEVVDVEVVLRSRLRVDTRKWYISKVLPKVYGDKLDLTSGGERLVGNEITFVDFGASKVEDSNLLKLESDNNGNSNTNNQN
jgi:hypothetical protein